AAAPARKSAAPLPSPPEPSPPPAPAAADTAGRGSPELASVRAKIQAKDFDGATADLRDMIAKRQDDRAPLDAYNALLEIDERRNTRDALQETINDLTTRFPSDPRVPGFLLRHAESAML